MMKRRYLLLFAFFAIILLQNQNVKAQPPAFDSLLKKALETDELLPFLIDSAVKYSSSIKRLQSNIDVTQENLSISKNLILNGINANSSFNYGTNFSAITNQNNITAGSNLTNAQSGFYNVGIGVQLPITQFINRKHILKAGKSQVEMAKSEKDVAIYEIKQEVIRLYHQFKLAHKLLGIASKNNQSAQINYAMIEKDFIQGQVTVTQLAAITEIANKSVVEFETGVNSFQSIYMQLEVLTNTSLLTLIRLVK